MVIIMHVFFEGKLINLRWNNYLPSSFNAVKILAKSTSKDPDLRQAEFIRLLYFGFPNVNGGLSSIIFISFHVYYRMLIKTPSKKSKYYLWEQINSRTNQETRLTDNYQSSAMSITLKYVPDGQFE